MVISQEEWERLGRHKQQDNPTRLVYIAPPIGMLQIAQPAPAAAEIAPPPDDAVEVESLRPRMAPIPEGVFRLAALKKDLSGHCTGYNLYAALRKSEGPFAACKVWRRGRYWYYDKAKVIVVLKSMGRWREMPVRSFEAVSGGRK